MRDFGRPFRRRIIHGPKAAKRHYQALIARGLREEDAANMSGWHPADEFDRDLRIVAWVLVLACLTMLGIAWVNGTIDVVNLRFAADEWRQVERALVSCLNGGEMVFGDERFACIKLTTKG